MTAASLQANFRTHANMPAAAKGDQTALLAPTTPADDNLAYTSIAEIGPVARYITLYIKVTAATAANEVRLIPFVNGDTVSPASGDDEWYPMGVSDVVASSSAVIAAAQALPTGADWSLDPAWALVNYQGLIIGTRPVVNATDKIRMKIKLDVGDARWIQIVYADVLAAGTKASIAIDYVLSC